MSFMTTMIQFDSVCTGCQPLNSSRWPSALGWSVNWTQMNRHWLQWFLTFWLYDVYICVLAPSRKKHLVCTIDGSHVWVFKIAADRASETQRASHLRVCIFQFCVGKDFEFLPEGPSAWPWDHWERPTGFFQKMSQHSQNCRCIAFL